MSFSGVGRMRVCAWDAFSVDRLIDVTTGVAQGALDGMRISQDATMGNVGGLLVLTQRHVMAVANASMGNQPNVSGISGQVILPAVAQMVCEADEQVFVQIVYFIGVPDDEQDPEFGLDVPEIGFESEQPRVNPTPALTPIAAVVGYQSVQPTDLTNAAVRIGQSPQMGFTGLTTGFGGKSQGVAKASNVMSVTTVHLSKNVAAIATSLQHINNSIVSIQEVYRLDVANAITGFSLVNPATASYNLAVIPATMGETSTLSTVTQLYNLIVAIAA